MSAVKVKVRPTLFIWPLMSIELSTLRTLRTSSLVKLPRMSAMELVNSNVPVFDQVSLEPSLRVMNCTNVSMNSISPALVQEMVFPKPKLA